MKQTKELLAIIKAIKIWSDKYCGAYICRFDADIGNDNYICWRGEDKIKKMKQDIEKDCLEGSDD